MLNPLEMQAYIQAIAARADMRVDWEEDVEQPRTDGRTIWLPSIKASMTEEQYATLKHYVAHEVDHVRFTDFEVSKNEPTCKEGIYGSVLNMVEDLRVEKKGSDEFLGDRINSGNVQSSRIEQIGKTIPARLKKRGPDAEMLKQAVPLLEWSHKHWSNMYPAVSGSASIFKDACESNSVTKKYMERFAAGDYDEVIKRLESTADAIKLAERIAREVYEVDPDEERKKAAESRKQDKKKGGNKNSKDKDEANSEGDSEGGDGEGEGKESEGEGEGEQGSSDRGKMGKGNKKREQEATVDFSSVMPDPHVDKPGATRTALHIVYKDSDTGSGYYNPAMKEDYKVWPRLAKGGGGPTWGRHNATWYIDSMRSVIRRTNPNFAHKVRMILQMRAKDRVEYGKKQGHLHQGALHRLTVKDAPHYAERVFKKRVVSDVLDSCVFLLVDQSGSMGGTKFTHAAVAASMMNDVIGNVLHIPTFIASFTDWGSNPTGNGERCNIHVHREWKDQLLNSDTLLQSFAHAAEIGMSGNADGDAIMWAYNKIATQRQKRKLIIVFSDGSPAGGGRGAEAWYTKKVIQSIEEDTPINIVGIGLMDHNVELFYKEHYVISKIDTLEEALLATIEGKLK